MLDAALQAGGVDVDDQHHALVHGDRERLRAAHAAAAAGEGQRAGEGAAEPCAGDRAERLVRALQDALRADVDPRAGGHLAVHGEAELLEPAELGPRRPVAHEVRVRDEHARRPLVRAEHADGLARLHEQGLVGLEVLERAHDRVERLPVAGGLARAAVDDEVLGALGDLGVEVVHEHAQRRLGLPALRGELGAARGADGARGGGGCVGHASITPHAASVDNGCRVRPRPGSQTSRRRRMRPGQPSRMPRAAMNGIGVDRDAVEVHLEVEVASGRRARAADRADQLAGRHRLARGDEDAARRRGGRSPSRRRTRDRRGSSCRGSRSARR